MNSRTILLIAILPLSRAAVEGPRVDDAWIGSIRSDHPRLFFNAQTWPAINARTPEVQAA